MKNPKYYRLLTLILALVLLVSLVSCGKQDDDVPQTPTESAAETEQSNTATEATDAPAVEPEPVAPAVTVNMGTVITGKLNIRKDAGAENDVVGTYVAGDRVEILETKTVSGTIWGHTSKGWIGMGYVRMDGVRPTSEATTEIISDGQYTVLGYGVIDLESLNVRSGPGEGFEKIKTVSERTRYAYYQESDGWYRMEDGWVSAEYFYVEGTAAGDSMYGRIITDNLNIRTGPSTDFASVGTCMTGDPVDILGQVDGWGYTDAGWVSMKHVETRIPDYPTGTGKVTTGLNIRLEPNSESEKVGVYHEGDSVTILEVNGGWGKTDQGWINLLYVKFDQAVG